MINSIYERYVWPSLLFVWLRFRIRYNQISRGSQLTKVFALIGTAVVGMSIVSIWLLGFTLGFFVPKYLAQEYYFLIWEGVLLLAMLMWCFHVLNEAQRGDPISLDKILHLPVSPSQAFVVNYLASLATPIFLMTAGGCLGLVIGSLFSVGLVSILFLLPMIAFLFAMTSATYWLQGWLATLMINPRTKQLVLVFMPILIIVATQVPVQFFLWFDRSQKAVVVAPDPRARPADAVPPTSIESEREAENQSESSDNGDDSQALAANEAEKVDGSIDHSAVVKAEEREKRKKERAARRAILFETALSYLKIANYALPPLWGVAAIEALLEGYRSSWKALFFCAALFLVGAQFLRWSYRSTLAYWKGDIGNRKLAVRQEPNRSQDRDSESPPIGVKSLAANSRGSEKRQLHELSFPLLGEDSSAMVAMTLACMRRAPEVKLFLLMPLLAPLIALLFLRGRIIPENDYLKCLMVCGFAAFMLLMSCGVAGNTFGFDRAGFRTFVLSGMERWRILLGKNLAHGALVGLLLLPIVVGIEIYLGISVYLGVCALLVVLTVLPLFALLMNLMAIYTPFPLGAGGIQPKSMDFMTVAVNLLLSSILPFIFGVALIPLGIEWLVGYFAPSAGWIPIAVPLSLGAIAGSVLCYRSVIGWQGKLLQSREKEVLRIVTSKLE